MIVKINKNYIFYYILSIVFLLVLILGHHSFYLFTYPTWMDMFTANNLDGVVALLGGILSAVCFYKYRNRDVGTYRRILQYQIFGALVWAGIVLYSANIYTEQPLSKTMGVHICLLCISWVIPILSMIYLSDGIDSVFRLVNIVIVIWELLLVYQFIVWRSDAITINDFLTYFDEGSISVRTYGIRIGLGIFGNIAILYNYDRVIHRRVKGFSWWFAAIQTVLGLFCMIFVQQTRAFIVINLLGMLVVTLAGVQGYKKKLILIILCLIGVIVLSYSETVTDFIQSFMVSANNDKSFGTSIRLDAIKYYMNTFVKTGFIGSGFASSLYYPLVQHGPAGQFYYSDVGIFGLIGEIGIWSLVFYLIPLYRAIKTVILIYKRHVGSEYAFYIGVVIFMIGTSLTLIITDQGRIMALPFIIAYTEFINYKLKRSSIKVENHE